MIRFGIVSYNMYCNFTNYGSALQTWALYQAINKISGGRWEAVLVDYCPDILSDKDPLNPLKNMWDQDEESLRMCQLTMPSIRENYAKFNKFYQDQLKRTKETYTSKNFNKIIQTEKINGFVCGSDTIFCPDEFGFDDGYYANYEVMRGKSVAYAASFGDPHFTEETYPILNDRLQNFKAFGLRENLMVSYVMEHTSVPVQKVIDPTLLLISNEYEKIIFERKINEKYLLLYSRRYNPIMEEYAETLAQENRWKIVEISLRASNAEKGHIMAYDAGIEEFLWLVKNAEYVITNSFHGLIFSVQFRRNFLIFSRQQCDTKIGEMLDLFGIPDRMITTGWEGMPSDINYDIVHSRISDARNQALQFLNSELEGLI